VKLIKWFLSIIALGIGLLAIVAGEADDSPGLQGIGLMIVLYVIYKLIRTSTK